LERRLQRDAVFRDLVNIHVRHRAHRTGRRPALVARLRGRVGLCPEIPALFHELLQFGLGAENEYRPEILHAQPKADATGSHLHEDFLALPIHHHAFPSRHTRENQVHADVGKHRIALGLVHLLLNRSVSLVEFSQHLVAHFPHRRLLLRDGAFRSQRRVRRGEHQYQHSEKTDPTVE